MESNDGIFAARRDALWADVVRPLHRLYGHRPDFDEVLAQVEQTVAQAYAERSEDLKAADEGHLVTPDWYQRSDMIGYVCYADRFAGDLAGVGDRLDYLDQLQVNYLHLLPLLKPRPGPNDGGYAVADYRQVDPRLGTMADLRTLAAKLRAHQISLVVDLVCSHTAAEHEWARKARAGDQDYRDYYWFFDDRGEPDQWEEHLVEVFPDSAPGNFTWLDDVSQWVWTTFHPYQWDLNYTNPAVFREMLEVMCFLANQGVEVLRLDALGFMWKRTGTSCRDQPETHLLVQAFRALTKIVAPGLLLLANAPVAQETLVSYLGHGESTNKECELAYHNTLMAAIWSALAEQKAGLLATVLRDAPEIPSGTAWITYGRNHDDIGWTGITDEAAARIGADGWAHRDFLSKFYAGKFPGSFARGEIFQYDRLTGESRNSGTMASLAGLDAAPELPEGFERSRATELAIARILLIHGIVLAFGGLPVIYGGDELGLRNDPGFRDDPERAGDNRWMHRSVMDWQAAARRFDPGTIECRIFSGIAHLAEIRKSVPAFHAQAETVPVETGNERVFGLLRRSPRGTVLLLANVSDTAYSIGLHSAAWFGPGKPLRNLITGHPEERTVRMNPYQVMWLAEIPARDQPLS